MGETYLQDVQKDNYGLGRNDQHTTAAHSSQCTRQGVFSFSLAGLNYSYWRTEKRFLRTFTSTKDQGQLDDQCPKTTSLGWEDVSSLWWTAMGVSETTSSAVKTHSYHLIYSCLSPRPVKPVAWKGNTHSLRSPGHYPPLIKTWDILLACYTQVFAMALAHSWRGLSHISSTKFIKQA